MTRRGLPSRAVVSALLALSLIGAEARAEGGDTTVRQPGTRSVFGAPHTSRCRQAVAAGVSDDAALQDCDIAIRDEGVNGSAGIGLITNRGILHMRRREGEAAVMDFDTVISRDPRNAEAYLNKGAALVMLKKPGPAVAAITTALSYGVAEPYKAYFNRAAAREAMGDVRGAYEDYNTALTIRPDWGAAEAELARFARGRRERLAAQLNDPDYRTAASPPPPRTP